LRSYTRHQLKEDRFVTATNEAVHWTGEHRTPIVVGLVAIVVLLAGVIGGTFYFANQDDKASLAFGNAMRTYSAPIRSEGQAAQPDLKSFASSAERSKAAFKEFVQVADSYPRTRTGKFASYMAGLTAMDTADSKTAEDRLQKAASSSDSDISNLAKFALASFYRSTGKESEALRLYKEVIDANSLAVPKTTAQLELAAMYEPKQPDQAIKIYEDIQKEAAVPTNTNRKGVGGITAALTAPRSPVAELASAKLQQLRKNIGK
jgi:predicted negative regulator of RcsB-dependent stress response